MEFTQQFPSWAKETRLGEKNEFNLLPVKSE